MLKRNSVFSYEIGPEGARIVPMKDIITNAAVSENDLNRQIRAAIADLEATAERAKAALRKYLEPKH